MKWPQVTFIVLLAIGWVATLLKHGETKVTKHDIGIQAASVAVTCWLLWCGGFFD